MEVGSKIKSHFDKFQTNDEINLYWGKWFPESNRKATILLIHGLMDHIDIYDYIAIELAKHNIATYAFDMRGFGRSEGERGYIESYVHWLDDVKLFFDTIVFKECENTPIYLLTFSMGSVIGINYARSYPEKLFGAIFTEVGSRFKPIIQTSMSFTTLAHNPKSSVKTIMLPAFLTDGNDITNRVYQSPYTIRTITASFGAELEKALRMGVRRLPKITMPVFFQYGTEDSIFEGQDEFFDNIGSNDKTIKAYQGLRHDIYKEDKEYRDKVIEDLIDWLEKHI